MALVDEERLQKAEELAGRMRGVQAAGAPLLTDLCSALRAAWSERDALLSLIEEHLGLLGADKAFASRDERVLYQLHNAGILIAAQPMQRAVDELHAAERDALREALEHIRNPIAYLRAHLAEGERLDGRMASLYADDPNTYREIARKALEVKP